MTFVLLCASGKNSYVSSCGEPHDSGISWGLLMKTGTVMDRHRVPCTDKLRVNVKVHSRTDHDGRKGE